MFQWHSLWHCSLACLLLQNLMSGPELLSAYGPVESAAILSRTNGWKETHVIAVMSSLSNCQCHIVDPRTPHLQPPCVLGGVLVGGAQVARCYQKHPELAVEKFISCFWEGYSSRLCRASDLVRWLPCGELAYRRRIDSQVMLWRRRVELEENKVPFCRTGNFGL